MDFGQASGFRLAGGPECVTLCHMKTITIRELHANTGKWVRQAANHGEILVTDRGEPVAKILPPPIAQRVPYFARRKLLPAFAKLAAQGAFKGGRDATELISEDREDRV